VFALQQACVTTPDEAIESCHRIGYPVMLKASWGGGGKGIRKVHSDEEVRQVFKQIQGEVSVWVSQGFLQGSHMLCHLQALFRQLAVPPQCQATQGAFFWHDLLEGACSSSAAHSYMRLDLVVCRCPAPPYSP